MVEPFPGQRQTDQPPAMLSHEVDDLWSYFFGGDGEIALILAVFVVDHHDHAAGTEFLECFRDRGEGHKLLISL